MIYAADMYSKALKHPELAGMNMVLEKQAGVLPFPLDRPYVSFGTEYESGGFLLGSQNSMITSEYMVVNVAVSEEINEDYCRSCARTVTLALMSLDTDKRIISVSAGSCEHDEAIGSYTIKMKFGLREVLKNGGD